MRILHDRWLFGLARHTWNCVTMCNPSFSWAAHSGPPTEALTNKHHQTRKQAISSWIWSTCRAWWLLPGWPFLNFCREFVTICIHTSINYNYCDQSCWKTFPSLAVHICCLHLSTWLLSFWLFVVCTVKGQESSGWSSLVCGWHPSRCHSCLLGRSSRATAKIAWSGGSHSSLACGKKIDVWEKRRWTFRQIFVNESTPRC